MSALPKPDNVWKLAEAKNKLSEVVNKTLSEGRQEIHRRGDVVVLIRKDELDKLEGKEQKPDAIDVLLAIPKHDPESGEPSLTELILQGRRYFREWDE